MSVTNLSLERYPTSDLLKLVANMLTHIAQTNDRNPPVSIASGGGTRNPSTLTLTSAARTVLLPASQTSTTTTFHARNVPSISLEAYLLRILKYCPTSNFVFLSLLVYFDRMAALSLASSGGKVFRVDSYNVHRLVIAGVAVASKFLSDVFYTNSRYAKVGGLPLQELNQLELQFLLLNDFRLVISPRQIHLYTQHLISFSLEHPPSSIPVVASLSPVPVPLAFPKSQTKNKQKRTPAPPSFPPASPPLGPSSSPSPSPSNSSSSSLVSSPSSPHKVFTNGHHLLPKSSHSKYPSLVDEEGIDGRDFDDDSGQVEADEDCEETETLASTSTDDDSEPTIRGPRTVVGSRSP